MTLIKFVPFGRGAPSTTTQISSVYDALNTMSTSIAATSFHPNAQIHESHFTWNKHNHADGSLGTDVIGQTHLEVTGNIAENARLIYTAGPRTLCLVGSSAISLTLNDPAFVNIHVDFASTSVGGVTFPPGTIPTVLPEMRVSAVGSSTYGHIWSYYMTSVTSMGFDIALFHNGFPNSITGYFTYFAIGVAPGILVRP